MKNFIILLLVSITPFSFASYEQAPPSFAYKNSQAVFVQFESAVHNLNYNFADKTLTVESTIQLNMPKAGHPIFDLGPDTLEVLVDGQPTQAPTVADPDKQTLYRILDTELATGAHTMSIKHAITHNVVFNEQGVASAFWLSDLTDRKYLEQYLPANFEFDQYPKTFNVKFEGFGNIKHTIKANGKVSQISDQQFEVVYPDFYTNSSVFFHVFPESSIVNNAQFYYKSVDGRLLPVDIYAIVEIQPFVELTKTLLAELEADYGPFPYDQVLIYGNSLVKGGMEYSGATATGLLSLGHELFHSYNARGVMPANGNAGWMDEAMSRWRDNLYPMAKELTFDYTRVAGHSIYRRFTDRMAYTEGSAFLSLIAHKMNEKGLNLKAFLREYLSRNMHQTVTTGQFEQELTEAAGMDLSEDFNKYIYGKYAPTEKRFTPMKLEADPHHPELSEAELLKLTTLQL